MDGSWATMVPAAASASDAFPRPTTTASSAGAAESGGMASVSPTRSSSRVLAGRVLAGRMFAALRQGVRRQAQVAAETVEADAMLERRAQLKSRGAKEDKELERLKAEIAEQMELLQEMYAKAHVRKCKELERLKAEIAEQMELLQQDMRGEAGLRKCKATGRDELMPEPAELQHQQSNDSNAVKALLTSCDDSRRQRAERDHPEEPLQHFGAPASSDLQLRKDTLEARVKSSRTELLKKKFEREFLEEKLNALECQFPDSTAEKEEIRSLLGDLADQTVESTNTEEQVQKALKDIQELRAENDASEALQQLTENEAIGRDELLLLAELQQSNDAVKALLKKSCEDLQRQRAERKKLEAKLRAVERQLSDVKKQDEMKTLLRNFALFTAANSKAEAAIQAVLNDLEALETSKDKVATASLMGEAAAGAKDALLERIELHEAMLNCESSKALGDCQRVPDSGAAPPESAGQARYDLQKQREFAQFLKDADIRLVRAKYLNDLARSKRPLPRRQEAEHCKFEFDGKAESALVRHDEVQNWAEGARTATICSVSHAWETKEHPDPCRYQLELVANRAAWYEAAFETEMWIFYDFTPLFQFKRLLPEEERSFRAAMDDMHVMYSHECTMTFRIETLTPKSVWKSTKENDQELIPVWDANSERMESKPLKSLEENRTPYLNRGWCIGEISWSSLRYHNAQDQRIDCLGSDQVEPDSQGQGLTGKVPLTPDRFQEVVKDAKFTHRDNDLPLVIRLQEKIFQEKVAKCEHLVLKGLPAEEIRALARALPRYRSLTTLKLDTFECDEEAAKAFGEALATSQVVSLELKNPQPQSGALMGKAVVDALTTNQSLTSIGAEDESIFDLAAKKALEKALRRNRSIKDRLPLDAPVRLKVVADALERNSLVTSVTVDPAEDQIDDQKAKAVAQLLKSGSPVKSIDLGNTCISDDGAQALAEALRCNRTLEELCLQEDQITDVGAEALAKALEVNKTLRSLTVAAPWESIGCQALRTVEEMKRGRGDDFRFISADEKEAEGCRGDIWEAARKGNVGAVRHLLRTEPGSLQQTDRVGDTPLHQAAANGRAKVVELLLAANAPVDVQNRNGDTPLHQAAAEGKTEVVELLVAANAPLDVKNQHGNTPLHGAAKKGSAEVVELLLAANAPVDVKNNQGGTPLHPAARYGHAEVVQLLLEAKAQVDVQMNDGQTPLHLAAASARGHVEVVKLLVEVASLAVQDKDGDTPLHRAAVGSAEVVELLLAANAPVDVKNNQGRTPLHKAASNSHAEVVQRLVKAKAHVDVQMNDGQTPLHLAATSARGHVEVVNLLVEVASLAVQDEDGDTPLHRAAANGSAKVVELLVAANAPVDVQNNDGQTPLDLARKKGKTQIVQLLEAAQAVAPRAE